MFRSASALGSDASVFVAASWSEEKVQNCNFCLLIVLRYLAGKIFSMLKCSDVVGRTLSLRSTRSLSY